MAGPLKGYLWTTGSSYEYILGQYENPEVMKVFLSWLKPDSVLYDLGANIGFHALTANRFINTGKIYSFEPFPAARLIFQKHVDLNKKFIKNNNISLLAFAVSDSERQVEFSDDEIQKDGNTYIKGSAVFSGAKKIITVQAHAIDELVKKGYDKPDIIKIDVEGAEYDVLRGAIDTIRQYKPNIILATHDYHLPGVKSNCIKFLEELGYTLEHTGWHNRHMEGIEDYIAVHQSRL